jgi:hypothetical protein
MLKLNSSYSKKVPAEQEYSSKSYHASVEVELPDGLTTEQLQEKIHATFELVRCAVEAELNGTAGQTTASPAPTGQSTAASPDTKPFPVPAAPVEQARPMKPVQNAPSAPLRAGKPAEREPASNKQLRYLLDLGRRFDLNIGLLNSMAFEQHHADTIYELGKHQCSQLIDSIRSQKKAA